MPVQSQTRKERKAAERAQWEREQRHKAEEDELRHRLRMDSLVNAQKIAAEQAAKAEADKREQDAQRRQQEAEAKVQQEQAAQAAAMQEVEVNDPCGDYQGAAEAIFGRGMAEDLDQQLSVDIARNNAIEELASQLSTKVQALVSNYRKQERKMVKRESLSRVEALTQNVIDQTTSYRIACRKTLTYVKDGVQMYKTYVVVELNEDQVLNSIFSHIQRDGSLKMRTNYQAFKQEFDENFKNQHIEPVEISDDEEEARERMGERNDDQYQE